MIPYLPRRGPVSNGEGVFVLVAMAMGLVLFIGICGESALSRVADFLGSDWWVVYP